MNNIGGIQVTARDRVLLVVLPALTIFILYAFVFTKNSNARLKTLTTKYETAEKSRPKSESIQQQQATRDNAASRLAQTKHELAPLRQALDKQMDTWQDRRARLISNDELSTLWGRHHMILIEQTNVSTNDFRVTPLIERLQQQTRSLLNREFGPVLWEVRLLGGFVDMQSSLDEIAHTDLPVIPVTVDMRASTQGTSKLWTVHLWQ